MKFKVPFYRCLFQLESRLLQFTHKTILSTDIFKTFQLIHIHDLQITIEKDLFNIHLMKFQLKLCNHCQNKEKNTPSLKWEKILHFDLSFPSKWIPLQPILLCIFQYYLLNLIFFPKPLTSYNFASFL